MKVFDEDVVGAIYVVGWKTKVVGEDEEVDGEVDFVLFMPKLKGVMQTGTMTVTTVVPSGSASSSPV